MRNFNKSAQNCREHSRQILHIQIPHAAQCYLFSFYFNIGEEIPLQIIRFHIYSSQIHFVADLYQSTLCFFIDTGCRFFYTFTRFVAILRSLIFPSFNCPKRYEGRSITQVKILRSPTWCYIVIDAIFSRLSLASQSITQYMDEHIITPLAFFWEL